METRSPGCLAQRAADDEPGSSPLADIPGRYIRPLAVRCRFAGRAFLMLCAVWIMGAGSLLSSVELLCLQVSLEMGMLLCYNPAQ